MLIACALALNASAARLDDERDEREIRASIDADYEAGVAAFEMEEWQHVIGHLKRVVARDPRHDDAHSLLGFAYRKLGAYERSLAAYDKALEINPDHQGALEYLGEAYLELEQPDKAKLILDRLGETCKKTAGNADWHAGCEEWVELEAAYRAYVGNAARDVSSD